jgi:lysozyme
MRSALKANQMAQIKTRSAVAVLALSAAGFVGIISHEGYTERAVIPVPGDVPTIGLGSTVHEDGSPVQMGETITPPKAIRLSVAHIAKDEVQLRKCFFGDSKLYQHEWDAYVSLGYNIGFGAVCRSSIPAKVRAEQYEAACLTIGDFVCGPATNATRAKLGEKCYRKDKAMRVLRGLENRRKEEVALCLS